MTFSKLNCFWAVSGLRSENFSHGNAIEKCGIFRQNAVPERAGEIYHHNNRQWFPDERDGFILWLRGEFAVANTMIDSLCHHLWAAGEYDAVIACIQLRRCNWNLYGHSSSPSLDTPISDSSPRPGLTLPPSIPRRNSR
ncbi:hypothetical protein L484_019151 [Morus notabilis]|uniref:Uncharacterized protein n=1 Tax=Morus notabilis TaxID=981085 RepID=W9QUM7_9ROSA|nr:hypothetical protein L484_019151 [Morus notabilis]